MCARHAPWHSMCQIYIIHYVRMFLQIVLRSSIELLLEMLCKNLKSEEDEKKIQNETRNVFLVYMFNRSFIIIIMISNSNGMVLLVKFSYHSVDNGMAFVFRYRIEQKSHEIYEENGNNIRLKTNKVSISVDSTN